MRTLHFLFVLLLAAASCGGAMAQPEDVTIQFVDADSKLPVTGVTVLQNNSNIIGISDEYGFVVINNSVLHEYPYVYVVFNGYKTDTLNTANPPQIVYLYPLSVSLKETVISSEKVKRVLHSAREYVVDYVFAGGNILVASFSGANGRQAKLFLLDEAGDTIVYRKLDKEPLSLFKSCVGTYYMASTDGLYPVDITDKGLQLEEPYSLGVLQRLDQCKAAIGDNLYYKFTDAVNFTNNFERACKGDTIFYAFGKTGDSLAAEASLGDTEYMEHLMRLGEYVMAEQVKKKRDYYDRTARKMVNTATLYPVSDSIVIFDPKNYKIHVFDSMGFALYQTELERTRYTQFACLYSRIIHDPVTHKCYTHNYTHESQYLQEIDITKGTLGKRIPIERPFAENIKLYNGIIYYLWQNKNGGTRQLFKQMI